MAGPQIKVMVATTVYPNRDFILQVCGMIQTYGYIVLNNEFGTVFPTLGSANVPICLDAVEECDIFFGLIQPKYSTGITHQEFQKACDLNKPRRFMAHSYVTFARKLLKQFMYENGDITKRTRFKIEETSVMDDIRVIDMYNLAIQQELSYADRKYHWVHEYYRQDEAFRFVETLFADIERVERNLRDLTIMR